MTTRESNETCTTQGPAGFPATSIFGPPHGLVPFNDLSLSASPTTAAAAAGAAAAAVATAAAADLRPLFPRGVEDDGGRRSGGVIGYGRSDIGAAADASPLDLSSGNDAGSGDEAPAALTSASRSASRADGAAPEDLSREARKRYYVYW